jgi:drug/metabolite transporter (DMT)-like permease
MAVLLDILLALLPIALFLAWRRWRPGGREPSAALLLAALLGLGLMIGGALWFGLSRSLAPGQAYAPAVLGADGQILPAPAR